MAQTDVFAFLEKHILEAFSRAPKEKRLSDVFTSSKVRIKKS